MSMAAVQADGRPHHRLLSGPGGCHGPGQAVQGALLHGAFDGHACRPALRRPVCLQGGPAEAPHPEVLQEELRPPLFPENTAARTERCFFNLDVQPLVKQAQVRLQQAWRQAG